MSKTAVGGAPAFVQVESIGLAGGLAPGGLLNIDDANVESCARVEDSAVVPASQRSSTPQSSRKTVHVPNV